MISVRLVFSILKSRIWPDTEGFADPTFAGSLGYSQLGIQSFTQSAASSMRTAT